MSCNRTWPEVAPHEPLDLILRCPSNYGMHIPCTLGGFASTHQSPDSMGLGRTSRYPAGRNSTALCSQPKVWVDRWRTNFRWRVSRSPLFRYARWFHDSIIADVSNGPRCHPGRSDFPSPVGGLGFPLLTCTATGRLKRWRAYTPPGTALTADSPWRLSDGLPRIKVQDPLETP